jgi:oxalate decarboxylase/phosphoglucose isomerase-like protein (cupin superfamily)
MTNQAYADRSHEKMKDVLMHPEASGPEVHYYMIRGGSKKRNITVWEPGTVGGEYIKAYGHYHVDDFIETYTILEGEGLLLLQMRKKDEAGKFIDDEIETFEAIQVKAGDIIAIPPFAGHTMVNTGNTWLVTSDDSPVNFAGGDSASMPQHADYEPMRKLRGFAYYVIQKEDGGTDFVKNTNYKTIPEVTSKVLGRS